MYVIITFDKYFHIDLFQTMSENENNKGELGAAYLQEMYEVGGNPDEVCNR